MQTTHLPRIAATIVLVSMVLAAWVLCSAPALPHGRAHWIEDGGYRNAVGELCCGERDCVQLPDRDVKVTVGGYYLVGLDAVVPYSQVMPSPDGTFWVCVWGGEIKCFFAGPPGS
jgi:hypothetical protein